MAFDKHQRGCLTGNVPELLFCNYSALFTKSSFPSASIGNLGVEPMDPRIREDDELAGECSMRG